MIFNVAKLNNYAWEILHRTSNSSIHISLKNISLFFAQLVSLWADGS